MLKYTWLLFIPLLLATFLKDSPTTSYSIAWLGSFYIFYITWVKFGLYHSEELPIAERIMKPIFLIQAIFVGFMCCTSIFYYYDIYQQTLNNPNMLNEMWLTAKSQRLSLLAHIALVVGISLLTKEKQIQIIPNRRNLPSSFYIKLTLICYAIGVIFSSINGLFQFAIYFMSIAAISGVYIMVSGIKQKRKESIIIGLGFFVFNFIAATLTGFKESIITNILIIAVLLFPIYKKTILVLSLPLIYLMVYILPTYSSVIRQQSWFGDTAVEEARSMALEQLLDEENEEKIKETNWEFLTHRASEISMFNQFVNYIPKERDFYGFEIIENSFYSIIPRVLWTNKPITETISMERVYEAGVVDRDSIVSAKTRPVVDGYLSLGALGVFIFIFLYGAFCQWAYQKSEDLFQSYELGGIVIFNGAFQGLWRGNNFEFIVNNMVYGLITVYLLYFIVTKLNLLNRE
jgi:hypothetical protein